MTLEQYEAFLADLMEVCKKHKATIKGCGCCGSPFGNLGDAEFCSLEVTEDGGTAEMIPNKGFATVGNAIE